MKNCIHFLAFLWGILVLHSCGNLTASDNEKTYRHVGDIAYDEAMDDPNFKVCYPDKIFQYFNNSTGPQYLDEKIALDEYFFSNYNNQDLGQESGWIRIRFVVNCEGVADRFRMIQSDFDYKERNFDNQISDQLLTLTKGIPSWPKKVYGGGEGDYYMYLIFKIENGQLIEIMP